MSSFKKSTYSLVSITFLCFLILLLASCKNDPPPVNSNYSVQREENISTDRKSNSIKNKIVDDSRPNFYMRFELDESITHKKTDTPYPYYKIKSNEIKSLRGTLSIENTVKDTSITLIAMQGRSIVNMSIPNENRWSKHQVIPLKKNHLTTINMDIEWDPQKGEELILFPLIRDLGSYYSGVGSSVIRLFVGDDKNYPIVTKEVLKHKHDFKENGESKLIPVLVWVDNSNQKIDINIDENDKPFVTKQYSELEIGEIDYDTVVDILYLNEYGKSVLLHDNYKLEKNKKHYIPIKDNMSTTSRGFILVVNNDDDSMLNDYYAVKEGYKQASTNFHMLIEMFPVKSSE